MKVLVKMERQEDLKITSSLRHTKVTTIYRPTISENDLETREEMFQDCRYKEGTTVR